MSKKLKLLNKIKIFIMYLKNNQDGVIVDCGICKSIDIKFKETSSFQLATPNLDTKTIESSSVYNSTYTCNKCGATCNNRQEWFAGEGKA